MNLRPALAFLALTACLPLAGCVVTQDGDKTIIQPATRFDGTPVSSSVAYAPGQAIKILSHNGHVTVVPGSGSEVKVTFSPFTLGKSDQADAAKREMEQNLHLKAGSANNVVSIEANVDDGSSSGLGADIKVSLPKGWTGAFAVTSDNGPVDADLTGGTPTSTTVVGNAGGIAVTGAAGLLSFVNDAGDIDVSVASWAAVDAGEGKIHQSGAGDIALHVLQSFEGSIQAQASGVLNDSTVPSSWQVDEAAANSKTYNMNSGAGGNVVVTADYGDITIDVQ